MFKRSCVRFFLVLGGDFGVNIFNGIINVLELLDNCEVQCKEYYQNFNPCVLILSSAALNILVPNIYYYSRWYQHFSDLVIVPRSSFIDVAPIQ